MRVGGRILYALYKRMCQEPGPDIIVYIYMLKHTICEQINSSL